MAQTNSAPFYLYKNNYVEFGTQQISSNYTEEQRSRISGVFVLCVIAVIIPLVIVCQIIPFNQTWVIVPMILLVFLGYYIMNRKLISYQYIGEITFTADCIKLSNEAINPITQINYAEISKVKAVAGAPHQVFRGNNQTEEYRSLLITFVLLDASKVIIEAETEIYKKNLSKGMSLDYTPHLEAILRDLYPNYKIVDERSFKYGRGWK